MLDRNKVYPNLFIVLLAPSAGGKTQAIAPAADLIRGIKDLKIGPNVCSKEQMFMELHGAKQNLNMPGDPFATQSAVALPLSELGTLIQPNDPSRDSLMQALCDLYDCPQIFEHKTKTSTDAKIEFAWLTFVAGVTPTTFRKIMTENAQEGGFLARLNIVYTDEIVERHFELSSSADSVKFDVDLRNALINDLNHMRLKLRGIYKWHDAAESFASEWLNTGMPPRPMDSRLQAYAARRPLHFLKLCMIVAAAKRSDKVILLDDVQEAQSILIRTEERLPDAMRGVGNNELAQQILTAFGCIKAYYKKHDKPISKSQIRREMWVHTTPQNIPLILDELVNAKMVKIQAIKNETGYVPLVEELEM